MRNTCFTSYYDTTEHNDDEEKIFTKVESKTGYKPSNEQLQKQIERAFQDKFPGYPGKTFDSAWIFKILITSKGCAKAIELTEGNYSSYTALIINQLKNNCNFIPLEGGGRPVHAYVEFFCRLNKDGSVTIDFP